MKIQLRLARKLAHSFVIVALVTLSIGQVTRTQAQLQVPACYSGARYIGTLSFTGDYDYQPNGGFYYSAASGSHKGCLAGPAAGADFDLFFATNSGRSLNISSDKLMR